MKTRMIKVECPDCLNGGAPYIAYMSRTQHAKGAPICPLCGVSMWSKSDFTASNAMRANIKRRDAPIDICQFIALRGGICPDGHGEIITMLNKAGINASGSYIAGGGGRLVKHNATQTLDYALGAAIEAGYFTDLAYESDLLDALERTLAGQPFYRSEDYGTDFINHTQNLEQIT